MKTILISHPNEKDFYDQMEAFLDEDRKIIHIKFSTTEAHKQLWYSALIIYK